MPGHECLRLLCSNGVKGAVATLLPGRDETADCRVEANWGSAAELSAAIDTGAPFDLAILTAAALAAQIARGRISGAAVPIGSCGIGIAVRKGAPRPPLATVDDLRHSLLAARSVAYTTQGASGIYFASLIARLGIANEIAAKAVTRPGGLIGELVARGEAELAVQQVSELKAVAGIDYAGPLPAEVQHVTHFAAGISASAREPHAARRLIELLTSPSARAIIAEHGLTPP